MFASATRMILRPVRTKQICDPRQIPAKRSSGLQEAHAKKVPVPYEAGICACLFQFLVPFEEVIVCHVQCTPV